MRILIGLLCLSLLVIIGAEQLSIHPTSHPRFVQTSLRDNGNVVPITSANKTNSSTASNSTRTSTSNATTNATEPPPTDPDACPNDCNLNGACAKGLCVCYDGFAPPDCSLAICGNNCSGHGDCFNGSCKCNAGFYGTYCDKQNCVDNCNGHGVCYLQTCSCYKGYSGVYCDVMVGCENNCNSQGSCHNNTCFCNPGYSGAGCENLQCPSACNGNGTCDGTTGQCSCNDGFEGVDCSKISCPNDCNGMGMCDFTVGKCICIDGYYGIDCAPTNCPLNCSSHGTCVLDTHSNMSYCKCNKGFAGSGCEGDICPGLCGESTGKGKCTLQGCVCSPRHTAKDCSVDRCPNDCTAPQNGKCDNTTFLCSCSRDWTGEDCSEKRCIDNCNNRGVCKNGTCSCIDKWWSGDACEIPTCKNKCSGNGVCNLPITTTPGLDDLTKAVTDGANPSQQLASAVQILPPSPLDRAYCNCTTGFGGDDCSKILCLNGCSANGICFNGRCFCNIGFFGDDCSSSNDVKASPGAPNAQLDSLIDCQANCIHGKCLMPTLTPNSTDDSPSPLGRYECLCEGQWAGPTCNQTLFDCPAACKDELGLCTLNCRLTQNCPTYNKLECGGRGDCINGVCKCNRPYFGDDCSVEGCPKDCSGKGMCQAQTSTCLCFAGFSGSDCSKRLW